MFTTFFFFLSIFEPVATLSKYYSVLKYSYLLVRDKSIAVNLTNVEKATYEHTEVWPSTCS